MSASILWLWRIATSARRFAFDGRQAEFWLTDVGGGGNIGPIAVAIGASSKGSRVKLRLTAMSHPHPSVRPPVRKCGSLLTADRLLRVVAAAAAAAAASSRARHVSRGAYDLEGHMRALMCIDVSCSSPLGWQSEDISERGCEAIIFQPFVFSVRTHSSPSRVGDGCERVE